MLNIALIGCGAIVTSLLEMVRDDAGIKVVAIVVPEDALPGARLVAASAAPQALVATQIPVEGIGLVVEAAGHAAIEAHVLPALRRGVPAIVVSVGALSTPGLAEALEAAARAGGVRAELIPGAIGAVDAIAAARIGGLTSVRYIGRKPPYAWKGTPADGAINLDELKRPTVVFEGSARDAARLYPKNANVAATISIAGLGLDATRVSLIADPDVQANIHTVHAEGTFGELSLTLRNKPLAANPKTSALTVYSAVRALRNAVGAIAI